MSDVVVRTELLVPWPAQALGVLLDVSMPDLERGAGLPLLWHWVYLLERPAQADLGPGRASGARDAARSAGPRSS
jgi:3-methylfumaryl-CoA hydratase